MRNAKGYTVIEWLVVIAIIVILLVTITAFIAVGYLGYLGYQHLTADESQTTTQVEQTDSP